MRDYRFDVARVLCMTYIVAFVHLYAYIHTEVVSAYFIPACATLTDACLGLFTFTSGYLLGRKYHFGGDSDGRIWTFYKKRLLRIIPLFIIASITLWLIGFNGEKETFNGIVFISPFVKPRPMTMWYIPVILYCYLIMPLISRKGIIWQLCSSVFVIGLLLVLEKKIPSLDKRLTFNVILFLIGIVTSIRFDWKMNFRNGLYVKLLIIFCFITLLVIGHQHGNFHHLWFKRITSGLGVFSLLFFCEMISSLLFRDTESSNSDGKKSLCSTLAYIIKYVSYASMAVYMFHRLFFWLGKSSTIHQTGVSSGVIWHSLFSP